MNDTELLDITMPWPCSCSIGGVLARCQSLETRYHRLRTRARTRRADVDGWKGCQSKCHHPPIDSSRANHHERDKIVMKWNGGFYAGNHVPGTMMMERYHLPTISKVGLRAKCNYVTMQLNGLAITMISVCQEKRKENGRRRMLGFHPSMLLPQ